MRQIILDLFRKVRLNASYHEQINDEKAPLTIMSFIKLYKTVKR